MTITVNQSIAAAVMLAAIAVGYVIYLRGPLTKAVVVTYRAIVASFKPTGRHIKRGFIMRWKWLVHAFLICLAIFAATLFLPEPPKAWVNMPINARCKNYPEGQNIKYSIARCRLPLIASIFLVVGVGGVLLMHDRNDWARYNRKLMNWP